MVAVEIINNDKCAGRTLSDGYWMFGKFMPYEDSDTYAGGYEMASLPNYGDAGRQCKFEFHETTNSVLLQVAHVIRAQLDRLARRESMVSTGMTVSRAQWASQAKMHRTVWSSNRQCHALCVLRPSVAILVRPACRERVDTRVSQVHLASMVHLLQSVTRAKLE